MAESAGWQIIDKRLLVDRSPYAVIYDEDVRLPSGEIITNFVRVELPDFVVVLALTSDERLPFVRQYRQAIRDYTLELPSGHAEPDEDPLIAAQRELREEAGFESEHWQFLGKFVMDANRQCGWAYIYLAREAYEIDKPPHGDLGDMTLHLLTLEEAKQRWATGELVSAPTALAFGLALNVLGELKTSV